MQFHSSLQESKLMATVMITVGFNEGSWFSYVDATRIITGINSLILVKSAALLESTDDNMNGLYLQYTENSQAQAVLSPPVVVNSSGQSSSSSADW